jgi:hypothetical protein
LLPQVHHVGEPRYTSIPEVSTVSIPASVEDDADQPHRVGRPAGAAVDDDDAQCRAGRPFLAKIRNVE